MDFKARIRSAFEAAGASVVADVLEELAQHAAATYAREEPRVGHAAAMSALDALIARWVSEASELRRPLRGQPIPIPPSGSSGFWLGIGHDVRYGVRLLRRQAGSSGLALLTIALAIAATTTLFSVAYGVLLRPLPWPDPDRLVRLEERRGGQPGRLPWTMSNATYLALANGSATVEAIGGWAGSTRTLNAPDGAALIRVAAVMPGIFSVLRASPVAGRLLEQGDVASANAAVVSHAFALRRFGSVDAAVGQSVQLERRPYTVVGVMPAAFIFPDADAQVWIPQSTDVVRTLPSGERVISAMIFAVLARMRPGVSPEQVAAEATARGVNGESLGTAALALFGSTGELTVTARRALDVAVGEVRPAIAVLFAAVMLLFVTAVGSVATVEIARAARRRREMTVRAALGAGTGRLVRQWLIEAALLGCAGGVVGVVGAALVHEALPTLLPADFPRVSTIEFDWRVAAFATAATLATSVLCGMIPGLQMRRLDLARSLAEEGAAPAGLGWRTAAARGRLLIMAAQVAIACVLLVGAGLLGRSLVALVTVDRGYDPRNLLSMRLVLPSRTALADAGPAFEALQNRLRGLAGVREAAIGTGLPLVTTGGVSGFKMPSPQNPAVVIDVQALHRTVSPGYFNALQLRLVAGRRLTDGDTDESRPVVVVNRTFAERYLGADPVGQILGFSMWDRRDWEVVGIVEDMRQDRIEGGAASASLGSGQPEMFTSYRQIGGRIVPDMMLVVRTDRDPVSLAPTVRALLREQAPDYVLDSISTMQDRLMATLAIPRLYALLLLAFAVFALAIAATGLFGVLSYAVAQRTREIGVRAALGAAPGDIVRLVLGQGAAIVGGGLLVGLTTAWLGAASLSKLVYGVSTRDLTTFVAAPLVVVAIAAIACFVPARRAARIDPLRALRS